MEKKWKILFKAWRLKMKICMPTLGKAGFKEKVSKGFEHVQTYSIFDTKNDEVSLIENNVDNLHHQKKLHDILIKNDVKIVLCGGLSQKFKNIFEELGIKVYIGASGTVREAIQLLRNGELQEVR